MGVPLRAKAAPAAVQAAMSANELTKRLLIEIPRVFPFTTVWRQNTVAAKAGDRFIRAGLPGFADISGICGDCSGRRIEVEVKVGKDRLSPAQMNFRDMILKAGGIWVCARSVEHALRDIQTQIDRYQMRWEK